MSCQALSHSPWPLTCARRPSGVPTPSPASNCSVATSPMAASPSHASEELSVSGAAEEWMSARRSSQRLANECLHSGAGRRSGSHSRVTDWVEWRGLWGQWLPGALEHLVVQLSSCASAPSQGSHSQSLSPLNPRPS